MSGYFRASARLAALLAVIVASGACNYGLRGGGGFPAHVRTLYIEPLENETPQFDVDQQILNEMNEELPRALGIRMAGRENADAVLRATVTRYEDVAQNYRAGDPGSIEVLQHQVSITMSVTIVDVVENVVLYESTNVRGNGEYRPDTQNDEVARTRAVEMLVQQILDGAQSQW